MQCSELNILMPIRISTTVQGSRYALLSAGLHEVRCCCLASRTLLAAASACVDYSFKFGAPRYICIYVCSNVSRFFYYPHLIRAVPRKSSALSDQFSIMSLHGQSAFITGGAKNLGALVASQLAAEGANVAIHYHGASSTEAADSLVADLRQRYPEIKVQAYQADLVPAANVKQIFSDILKDFGKLDIVVNTVGMVLKKPLAEISEQEYDNMFAVNSKSAFFIAQEAAKAVSDGGKIINIVTALLAAYTPFYSAYQGSKAPVEWFTKGLSKELMSRRVSVNAIAPGPMDTPFFYAQETEDSIAYLKSGALDGRLTKITDIAPIVKFLVSEGQWITGKHMR